MTRLQMTLARVPHAVWVLLAIDVAIVFVFFVDWLLLDTRTRLFGVDEESSVPTWYGSAQLLAVAAVWGVAAYERQRERGLTLEVAALAGLTALFLAMSIDEVGMVHEFVGVHLGDALVKAGVPERLVPDKGVWTLVGVPLFLGAAGLGTWALRNYFERGLGLALLGAGAALLVVSAAGLDLLANARGAHESAPAVLQVGAEELGEMLAVTLLLWGAARAAGRHLRVDVTSLGRAAPAAGSSNGRNGTSIAYDPEIIELRAGSTRLR